MGFFDELPAAEQEPPRRHHPWEPPEADLPGIVRIDTLQIARAERVAVAITGMSAHATGFEIFVTARIRPAGDHGPEGPGGLGAAQRSFRFGLQLADGTKVISHHGIGRRPDYGSEPDGPILRPAMGGGGPHTHYSRWWAWPLPPKGPLDFVCEWSTFGIGETRTTLERGADPRGRGARHPAVAGRRGLRPGRRAYSPICPSFACPLSRLRAIVRRWISSVPS